MIEVSERNAALGAAVPAALTLAAEIGGIDKLIARVADFLFEGDRGDAAFAVGGGGLALGAAHVLAATHGPLGGMVGMVAIAAGIGVMSVAAPVLLEAL